MISRARSRPRFQPRQSSGFSETLIRSSTQPRRSGSRPSSPGAASGEGCGAKATRPVRATLKHEDGVVMCLVTHHIDRAPRRSIVGCNCHPPCYGQRKANDSDFKFRM